MVTSFYGRPSEVTAPHACAHFFRLRLEMCVRRAAHSETPRNRLQLTVNAFQYCV